MLAVIGNWRQMAAMKMTMLVQEAKLALVELTDLSKDALHIYVALTVFLLSCLIFKWKSSQLKPWLLVFAVTLAGEYCDMRFANEMSVPIDLWGQVKDILNTMTPPTLLFLAARYTAIFDRAEDSLTPAGQNSGDQS